MSIMKSQQYCECGCGEIVKPGNRFIQYHHIRGNNPMNTPEGRESWERVMGYKIGPAKVSQLCACGCGELTKPGSVFISGHNFRVQENPMKNPEIIERYFKGDKNSAKRPEVRKKISKGLENRPVTKHHREAQSKAMKAWYRDPENKEQLKKMYAHHSRATRDWDFYNIHGCTKTNYPYNDCFTDKFKEEIRKRDNNKCVITGMSNEEHKKKYGHSLHVHHWMYNKDETNPFYFVPVTNSINTQANTNKPQWIELFNMIAEEKYCEMINLREINNEERTIEE